MAWKKGIASYKTLAKELATAITTALDAEGLPMWELVPSAIGEFAHRLDFQGDGYVIKPTYPDFGEPLYLTIKPTYGYNIKNAANRSCVCEFISSLGFTPGEDGNVGSHTSPLSVVPDIFKRPLSDADIVGSNYFGVDIFRYEVRILKDNIVFMITNNESLFVGAEPYPWVGFFGKLNPLDELTYSSYALMSSATYGQGTTPGVPQVYNGHNQYEITSSVSSGIQFKYGSLYSGQMLATCMTFGVRDFSVGSLDSIYIIVIDQKVERYYPQICYQTIDGERYLVVKCYANTFTTSRFDFAPHSSTYYLMFIKGAE